MVRFADRNVARVRRTVTLPKLALLAVIASGCARSNADATPAEETETVAPVPDSNVRQQERLKLRTNIDREPLDDAKSAAPPASVETQPPSAQNDHAAIADPASVAASAAPAQGDQPISAAPSGNELAQLPALPPPSAGACAFEPLPSPAPSVDNINCPDGIWHGFLELNSDADVESARGCTRVTGSVGVTAPFLTSLRPLKDLRVIEGDLVFTELACSTPSQCMQRAPKLTDLAGLDALRCVGGELSLTFSDPFDASALHNLVEIGNDLQFYSQLPDETFASLRRVWGNVNAGATFAAPSLEAVYGHYRNPSSPVSPYIGCDADAYCRDGVLGCDVSADSPAQLQKLSTCEIAVHDVNLSGSALSALSQLDNLRYVGGTLDLYSGEIQTISGLASLRAVANLRIESLPNLKSLAGLSAVAMTKPNSTDLGELEHPTGRPGDVYLQDLPALENLNGLSHLESLSSLQIVRSAALHDLSGLGALREVGYLYLEDNANLQALAGTGELRAASGVSLIANPLLSDISAVSTLSSAGLLFQDLPALADLRAFHGVEITAVRAIRLPLLRNLDGLEAVRTAVSTIELRQNDALEQIDALSNVRDAFQITITENPKLHTVSGLAALSSVQYNSDIGGNPQLPECEVGAIQARVLSISGGGNDSNATCTP